MVGKTLTHLFYMPTIETINVIISMSIRLTIKFIFLVLLFVVLLFSGCQEEVVIVETPDQMQVIDESLRDLVMKTTMNDGSFDNILDNNSCTSVILPASVWVNGSEIQIGSESDFDLIVDALTVSGEDSVSLIFPVTLQQADYSLLTLHTEDELNAVQDLCTEEGDDDDMECLDFQYPISVSLYDTENQVSDILTFENDRDMHLYLKNSSSDVLLGFQFPVSMTDSDGSVFEIANHSELKTLLTTSQGLCDEMDMPYYDDSANTPTIDTLTNILTSGDWTILVLKDTLDHSPQFASYKLTFWPDGTLEVADTVETHTGIWKLNEKSGDLYLLLRFDNAVEPVVLLEDEWKIIRYDDTSVQLINQHDPAISLHIQKR